MCVRVGPRGYVGRALEIRRVWAVSGVTRTLVCFVLLFRWHAASNKRRPKYSLLVSARVVYRAAVRAVALPSAGGAARLAIGVLFDIVRSSPSRREAAFES